jgi:coxsackievirus/adenovirus receptor
MFRYIFIGLISSALVLLASGQECPCNKKYAPVCAFLQDGSLKEYPNVCHANCEGHTSANLFEGVCPCACTNEFVPVCGKNGAIFGNECILRCSGFERATDDHCLLQISQLPAVKRIQHRRQLPVCVCTMEYQPVCNKAGRPFANACTAKCAGADDASEVNCQKK